MTTKPDLTRVWANGASPSNVVDPDTTTPGKVLAGWLAEVPPFEHFNFLQKWFTQGLAHANEYGIMQWDIDTIYPIGAWSRSTVDDNVYVSSTDGNVGNEPSVSATWKVATSKTVASYAEMNALPAMATGTLVTLTGEGIGDDSPGWVVDDAVVTPNVGTRRTWANATGNQYLRRIFSGAPNVKWFSAPYDGTDALAEIQPVFNEYSSVYLPNANGEQYGLSAPLIVLVKAGFSIRADNPKRNTGQLFIALAAMESVLQLLDGTLVAGENIITMPRLENVSIDGNDLAVLGIGCGKNGALGNQLVKMVQTDSLSITRCRFGYIIGAAGTGVETDSAGYSNINTVIEGCSDGGVLVDTGNGAAISFTSPTINENGFDPTTDSYNPTGEGFNVKVIGGECNFFAATSAGAGALQPATADVIARSADIRINGWWSDTHGIFLDESGGSDSSVFLNGVRHKEASMTAGNTPVSIKHTCKMNITGSLLYGVVESNEGNSGSLTTMGVNFVPGGAAGSNATGYTGTLKTIQKGVISINNFGNRAQQIIGGGNVDMSHKGFYTPQHLQIGAGPGATGPTCLMQALGPETTDSGHTEQLRASNGAKLLYINCYVDDASDNIAPILTTKDSYIIELGGGSFSAMRILRNKFASSTPVNTSAFQEIFTILQGGSDATLTESVIVPPKLSANPSFSSGDYWEGGFYYNTTTNKLVCNVGGTTWTDLF